jgi:hypothetical protein
MVELGEIIRAPKSNLVVASDWKQGKIPATAFPIAKQKRFPQSSAWSWRTVEFDALGYKCRVLIRLNSEACYYSSILAIYEAGLTHVICHHEHHLSHRNWHCHFARGNVFDTMSGILRDRDRMRIYEASPSQSAEFKVDQASALKIAAARFRFDVPDETPAQPLLL